MSQAFAGLEERQIWNLLVTAAIQAVEAKGYSVTRLPGRGRYSVYLLENQGRKFKACIRTSRDRMISFPPVARGKKWKTLDDVDCVIVATVDAKINPRNIDIYMFQANQVRKRFDLAYAARTREGLFVEDQFGFWLALDRDDRKGAYSVGSGIADDMPKARLKSYKISQLIVPPVVAADPGAIRGPDASSIAEVLTWARQKVAAIAGVSIDAVKLDMKLEY